MSLSRFRLFSVIAAAALALSACSGSDLVAQSSSGEVAQSGPTIDENQARALIDDIQSKATQADLAKDPALLEGAFSGAAIRMRTGQYALATKKGSVLPVLDLRPEDMALTNSTTWPRTILSFSKPASDGYRAVYVLTQKDARSSYQVESWGRMLGSTSLTIPSVKVGSASLPADAQGFVKTPTETISGYVEMLNSGSAGNDLYASEEFAGSYIDNAKVLSEEAKEAGTVTSKATLSEDLPISTVVLEDGSLLVAGSFEYTTTYQRTIEGSTLRLGGNVAAMSEGDDDTVGGTATATYVASVIFQVPTAEQGGKITLIAGERVLESVKKDNAQNPDNPQSGGQQSGEQQSGANAQSGGQQSGAAPQSGN
ncbi:MAG: hypothetical protein Q4C87_05430 [Actinomycetaceae bacterium]|nr:hypothetical protein [Actinomycetaceae bacterium]